MPKVNGLHNLLVALQLLTATDVVVIPSRKEFN